MNCLIIVGGEECNIENCLGNLSDFFVIACDKGFQYAQNQNIKCDLVVGDFDSYKNQIPQDAIVLPTEKDDTDLMFAIKTAIGRGCKSITITCAMGGRADHFLSNVQCVVYALEQNVSCKIIDEKNEIFAIKNTSVILPKRDGWCFSVLSHSTKSIGVSIKGAKYPLDNVVLENSFPLGQSNEWVSDEVEVSVKDGILLIIQSQRENQTSAK